MPMHQIFNRWSGASKNSSPWDKHCRLHDICKSIRVRESHIIHLFLLCKEALCINSNISSFSRPRSTKQNSLRWQTGARSYHKLPLDYYSVTLCLPPSKGSGNRIITLSSPYGMEICGEQWREESFLDFLFTSCTSCSLKKSYGPTLSHTYLLLLLTNNMFPTPTNDISPLIHLGQVKEEILTELKIENIF